MPLSTMFKIDVHSHHCWYYLYRWYDKSFQLIIEGNGEAAIHFEHAWGDGVAVMRFFNEVHEESTKYTYVPSISTQPSNVTQHEFEFDQQMSDAINKSQKKFDNFVGKISFHAQEIEDFGKNYIKNKKLSPDGIVQLAFQVNV